MGGGNVSDIFTCVLDAIFNYWEAIIINKIEQQHSVNEIEKQYSKECEAVFNIGFDIIGVSNANLLLKIADASLLQMSKLSVELDNFWCSNCGFNI